jgi:adenine/guanine phosphoribosyltransferase-like PRPP-binding protein
MSLNPWPYTFPDAAHFTDTATLVAHPDFRPAKRGDYAAACRVVQDFAQWSYADQLVTHRRPRALAAVLSADPRGNQLPAALAAACSERYDLPVLPVSKAPSKHRTKTTAWDRLCQRPAYVVTGKLEASHLARVLMLDDVITTGGSLSELRLFLWDQNLWPVAATVIAATPSRKRREDGTRLAPRAATLQQLVARCPDIAERLANESIYDGDIGCLTEAEAQTLLAADLAPSDAAG